MNSYADQVTFTMKLDASDLKRLLGGGGVGGGAGASQLPLGVVGGGSNPQEQQRNGVNMAQGMSKNPSFMAIFKPLAVLGILDKTLSGILGQSKIASTYMGAMGKMFGAAIDLLLVPFIPLFNLIMVGMAQLIKWLITSGTLKSISDMVGRASGYLKDIVTWVTNVYHAIKEMDFSKLGSLIVSGVKDAVKTTIKDPGGSAATIGLGLGAAWMATKIPLIGPVIGAVLKAPFQLLGGAARGLGGLLGIGGGGAAAAGGGGGSAAAGGVGLLGLLGGALAMGAGGLAGGVATNWVAGKAGAHGTLRNTLAGAGAGAGVGAVAGLLGGPLAPISVPVGMGIGALVGGGIGFAKGMFGGGGGDKKKQAEQAAANGGSVSNSGNTINFTQNLTVNNNANPEKLAKDVMDQIEKKTGFKLATRGGG